MKRVQSLVPFVTVPFIKQRFLLFLKTSLETRHLNEKGFSLVGVLTASVIGVIVVIGTSQLSTDVLKMSRRASANYEMTDIVNEIRSLLMDETACKETLSNVRISTNRLRRSDNREINNKPYISQIKDASNVIRYKTGCTETGVTGTACTKGHIQFVRFSLPSSLTETTVPYILDLDVFLAHKERNELIALKPQTIKIKVTEMESSGAIKACHSLGGNGGGNEGDADLQICDNTKKSLMRFNTNESRVEYCNGNEWIAVLNRPKKCTGTSSVQVESSRVLCGLRESYSITVETTDLNLHEGNNYYFLYIRARRRYDCPEQRFSRPFSIYCESDGSLEARNVYSYGSNMFLLDDTSRMFFLNNVIYKGRPIPHETSPHRDIYEVLLFRNEMGTQVKDLFPYLFE